MSNLAQSWVWLFSRSQNLDRFVLLYLAYRYNEDKQRAWPSIKTIADGCGISTSSVKRSLKALEDSGELKIISRPSEEGDFNSNFYELPETQAWIEEVVRKGRVYREGGRFSGNLPGFRGDPGVGSTGAPNSLESNSTNKREEAPLPLCKEERRALPKPVKEPKVRKGFQRTLPAKREYVPPPKPPDTWNWFAKLWHRYTDVFPISRPEHWEAFDKLHSQFSATGIEERLSRWLEQRGGKITAWSAIDFLNECPLWTVMEEGSGGDIPLIVNEE